MPGSQLRLIRVIGASLLVALVIVQPACRKGTESSTDSAAGASGKTAVPSNGVFQTIAPGVDKDDDPDAPGALPRTGDVLQWVKTRAVRVSAPAEAASLIEDVSTLEALKAFRIESLADCRYNLLSTSADVLYVTAATPADAFGLLNLLIAEPGQLRSADRSFRASHVGNAAMRIGVQQGRVCVCINVAGRVDLETIQQASRRLVDFIVYSLPASDPPRLVQLVPESQRSSTKCWLVRDMNSLAKVDNPLIRRLTPVSISRILGLGSDAFVSIAAVPATDTSGSQLIWLVEYPSQAAAQAAYDRCSAEASQGVAATGLPFVVLAPKGKQLCGAWVEEAGLPTPLLKSLHDALPG